MDSAVVELIRARLSLYAVLQNLEDLVRLDAEMAQKAKNWYETVQFAVRGGPAAYLTFRNGVCKHGRGMAPDATVKLYFMSCGHLNAMFNKAGTPIPLKGFTKLNFLKNDFTALTDRLEYYLRPNETRMQDEAYRRLNTIFTLNTALFAARELAALEPVSKHLAGSMGTGIVQVEVDPEGPYVHLRLENGSVHVAKEKAAQPKARMIFRNLEVAGDLLNDRVDGFQAVVAGDVALRGFVPMIDSLNLILDRVRLYLA